MGLVAGTKIWSMGLIAGTKIWSLRLVPRIQTGLNLWHKFWSLRLDFVAKMASSHDATSPGD